MSLEELDLWLSAAGGDAAQRNRLRRKSPVQAAEMPVRREAENTRRYEVPSYTPPAQSPDQQKVRHSPVERRLRAKLNSGRAAVDGTLDLHGMRQSEAHGVLIAFLRQAQLRDHRIVAVVTGKGAGDAPRLVSESPKGVLRRQLPHWLSSDELKNIVLGFEEAGPRRGGAGALYVRVRRLRDG